MTFTLDQAIENGVPADTYTLEQIKEEYEVLYKAYDDARSQLSELKKAKPAIVTSETDADTANSLYGEAYGFDWRYENTNAAEIDRLRGVLAATERENEGFMRVICDQGARNDRLIKLVNDSIETLDAVLTVPAGDEDTKIWVSQQLFHLRDALAEGNGQEGGA